MSTADMDNQASTATTPTVADVYGEQIQVDGKWFHAERLFGRPAGSFAIGDVVQELIEPVTPKKDAKPDELVDSDLFRESGANISHTEEKIQQYADAMAQYGGWGKFPMIAGRIFTVTQEDVEHYKELDTKGIAHELTYSRPLTPNDVGRRIVHIENGHNRAYAAARHGFKIPVYDMELEEQAFAKPKSSSFGMRG